MCITVRNRSDQVTLFESYRKRQQTKTYILLRLLFVCLLLTSAWGCKKNEGCTRFGSDNYDPDAVIDDGSCIEARYKFIGDFTVYSDCFNSPYQRNISETTNRYVVTISNLADTLDDVTADILGFDITIEPQALEPGLVVEGAGVSSHPDTLRLTYRVRDSRSGIEVIHDCFEECIRN